jgi:heptosyltransferase II
MRLRWNTLRRDRRGHESPTALPWLNPRPPEKILAIRLQALGDTVITLPYMESLRNVLPSTRIDFLTREEFQDLPRNLKLFHRVYALGGGRNSLTQLASAFGLLPKLRKEKYDIVIDLQRNRLTRFVRRALHPKSFSEFDRFSLMSAGERTRITINKLGLQAVDEIVPPLQLHDEYCGVDKLEASSCEPAKFLLVLNPAGSYVTKAWPIENYVEFARLWRESVNKDVQFLILGLDMIAEKSFVLKEKIGNGVINLVGRTTIREAFNILRRADLVLSEDSGLMHMAWVAGVPTLALFGSSRSVWSKPLGKFSVCLDSSDLECGECLQPACRFGDVRCLTRYSPEFVVNTARTLLALR